LNAVVRARLDRIIRDLDGAIAAAKHDRAVCRSLWRARAEIVRARAEAERELSNNFEQLPPGGDVRDFEIG